MSVYKSGGRGSWIVERSFRGLGTFRRATGTNEYDTAREIDERMLPDLYEHRQDLLKSLMAYELTPLALYQAYRRFGLSYHMNVERAIPLKDAIDGWLKDQAKRKDGLSAKTLEDYGYSLHAVVRLRERAALTDLPALLQRYAIRKRKAPSQFNRTLSAARTFTQEVAPRGAQSDLFKAVAAIPELKEAQRQVGPGLAPATARAVAEALDRRRPGLGRMWWFMCTTGMHWKEYAIDGWKAEPAWIIVHGEKTDYRERITLRLTSPVKPMYSEWVLARELRAVGADMGIKKLTPNVARRTFAHLLELARVLDSQCDALMGHSPKSKGMRGLYREHELLPYLPEITKAVREAIGPEPRYLQAVNA